MQELTRVIREDMQPALGVTEPGAIAFAVASAKKYVKGSVKKITVALNSGMYKNAYTCGIPNSAGFGNLHAAALGAVAADDTLGLMCLSHITEEDNRKAEELIQSGAVEAALDHIGSQITIDATVETDKDICTVSVRDSHTNIRNITVNGQTVYRKGENGENKEDEIEKTKKTETGDDTSGNQTQIPVIHRYTFKEILSYVTEVPAEELGFIREAYCMNLELMREGIRSDRTAIGPMLLKQNGGQEISQDALRTAQLLCNGAIEARVLGLNKPAMSITGSGAHGIIAAMPLYAYYKVNCGTVAEENLLRATALSYLVTMYIKEYSGRLSAFCGCGIAAGTGMACGLAYMRHAGVKEETMVIQNMASGLTGMICDGGNQGCAMKGIVAVDAAFRAVDMAMMGVAISDIHGINGRTPEATMHHMGRIASPGMVKTEEVILDIMKNK